MAHSLLYFTIVVKDGERALLSRDGCLERMLGPGRHRLFDPKRALQAEVFRVVRADIAPDRADVVADARPDIAEQAFERISTGPDEVAIVSFDGLPSVVLPPLTRRAFWKVVTRIDVERIDTRGILRLSSDQAHRMDLTMSSVAMAAVVSEQEAALLFVDGKLVERLAPGQHAFWKIGREIKIVRLDLRQQTVDVTAQEILTKDRVGIRVTLSAQYRIVDAEKAGATASDVPAMLYRLVQFAVRESIASRTLDDILAARDTLDREIREKVSPQAADLGVELVQLGIKDVILPGEIRELMNRVIDAEKQAKANLIRRQEETAATRSLLNTARLMEENPLLLRLKELETLEKLVEKVGRIDLHSGGPGVALDSLMHNLYRLAEVKENKTGAS